MPIYMSLSERKNEERRSRQDLILKGDIEEIRIAMEESGKKGMQTFDAALHNLYKEGKIELEEALNNASSRTNLEAKINFG